jgi:hypothetical protein
MDLAANEFEWLSNWNNVLDSRGSLESLDFVPPSAADCGDDGALGSARDMSLVSGFADAVSNVLDLFFRGALGHVDNHLLLSW